ncbi:uncharacterized protein RCC_07458 [Ramularia collo-cygni]|uniref:Uncharacterized protein n=1 Tax=Ramularia collo-cygni TaxID=112498 RepID=A0A2D3VFD4_9PEZI|nr:uncharacterized protein RCC_07458 [Ramularia collo-cygni]CZT21594.1 uncharacterized protein RCC_07458 [Ramularia collo-cygni]
MAKGTTVNWDSQETWQRVVASIIATGIKIDYRQVALHFDTTYDTIENRFRKIKKEAAVLKEEVERGDRGENAGGRKSAPATPRKPKTPKKDPLSTVENGRVAKVTPKSAAKRTVKQEVLEEDAFPDLPDVGTGLATEFAVNDEFFPLT